MDHVWISDLGKHVGQEVEVRGWRDHLRSSGKLHFLEVRDGTGVVQCVVFKGNVSPELFDRAGTIAQEAAVAVVGTVSENPKQKGVFEIQAKDVTVLASPTREYPIGPKEHGVEFLMDNRHLWLRSRRQNAILKVRATIVRAIRDFFDGRGFTLVDAPIFTPNACEGTSTLFSTDYHGEP